MKVLIVDDMKTNVKLFGALLRQKGYEVVIATNGKDGIETAIEQRPDLVLMDIQMPVMDGIEAFKNLRAEPRTKRIPVIAVTSYAMVGDKERYRDLGFAAYIAKPIDIDDFLAVVERHLPPRPL